MQNPKLRLMPLPITMAVITVTPTDTVDITDMVVTDTVTVTDITDILTVTDITSAKDQLMPMPKPHPKPMPPHITELITVDITDTPMAVTTVTDTLIITTP